MKIFPAIDILSGQVVRLTQGDYARKRVYHDDPAFVARSFAEQHAKNLHVVDLDGAKRAAAVNFEAIRRIAQVGLFLEVGGGIRDRARVEAYLELGVDRVILGTAAIRDYPFVREMVARFGDRIAVGVDARDGRVAVEGWLETTDEASLAFCQRLADDGVSTVIYTDISRDGALEGANLAVYCELAKIKGLDIVASGGISSAADLVALNEIGVSAAIVGKAVYEGRLTVEEALKAGGETC